jgi:hypothetical protein
MKKRIVILSLVLLYLAFSMAVFCMFFGEFLHLVELYEEHQANFYTLFKYTSICVFCIFSFVICVLQITLIFKKTNIFDYVKLSYGQYKEMRQKKNAEKRKVKKEKLKKQLNELEKDTE